MRGFPSIHIYYTKYFEKAIAFLEKYKAVYSANDDKQVWFNKIKEIAPELNFASETKEYKANPDAYKGHVGDVSTVIRVAVTGKRSSPDMYEVMQILGKETVIERINREIERLA